MDQVPVPAPSLTNAQKMAVILGTLPDDQCVEVLKNFKEEEVVVICRELMSPPVVDEAVRTAILEEFYQTLSAPGVSLKQGSDYVEGLLARVYGIRRSAEIVHKFKDNAAGPVSLDGTVEEAGAKSVAEALQSERPAVAASALAALTPKKAAEVMGFLLEDFQAEIMRVLPAAKKMPEDLASRIRSGLVDKIKNNVAKGGVVVKREELMITAQILSQMPSDKAKKVLDALKAKDPEMGRQVESALFTFDDLLLLEDRDLQKVLAKVNQTDLKVAMRKCPDELKEKIFKNMSERMAAVLREDIQNMSPQKKSAVNEAQQKISTQAKKMEDAGDITVNRKSAAASSGDGPAAGADDMV